MAPETVFSEVRAESAGYVWYILLTTIPCWVGECCQLALNHAPDLVNILSDNQGIGTLSMILFPTTLYLRRNY